jgi:hypothetical protein
MSNIVIEPFPVISQDDKEHRMVAIKILTDPRENSIDITGSIIWHTAQNQQHYTWRLGTGTYYLTFLFSIIDAFNKFFLIGKPSKLEKHYIHKSELDKTYDHYLYIVNNTEVDGYIYFINHSAFDTGIFPINENGIMGENDDALYIGHQILIDKALNDQKELDGNEACQKVWKAHGYNNTAAYIKVTPEELCKDFVPCFEEHVLDIPNESLVWQTPLLKETMSNFQKLKAYAQEKGWVE